MCDALVDDIDASGLLKIFAGAQPANPNGTHSETVLAELAFSATAFGASSSGTATAAAITGDSSANATATATWFRIGDSTLTTTSAGLMDGDVNTSGADINFNSVAFTSGSQVDVTSLTITVPES
jgi:hypothetical protein